MKSAALKQTPGSSGLRFEVQSTPTRGHQGIQKWYLKANHPVEASRWIQALTKSIEWARHEAERASAESDAASLLAPSHRGMSGTYSRKSHNSMESSPSSGGGEDAFDSSSGIHRDREPSGDDEGEKTEASSVGGSSEREKHPPHQLSFELHGNSALAQMELTSQMLGALRVESSTTAAKSAMTDSLNAVQTMLSEYVHMVHAREEWYREKLEKERERQNVWEASLQAVVKEGELMERELRTKSRRRSRMVDGSGFVSEMGTIRNRPSQLSITPQPAVKVESPQPTPATINTIKAIRAESSSSSPPATTPPATHSSLTSRTSYISNKALTAALTAPGGVGSPAPRPFSLIMGATSPKGEEDDVGTDEEDEFFDAIESGTLPLVINDSLAGRNATPLPTLVDKSQYQAYEHLRPRLAISSDDRPPMSLWAVLKNSIGKDLT